MEQWLPLYVAVIGALGAIGVSFWNSRGESAALRQLKAMNDALASLPQGTDETEAFLDARNGLAVRIAARVAAAPARQRWAWRIVQLLLVVGFCVFGLVLAGPWLSPDQVASGTAIVAVAGAGLATGSAVLSSWRSHTRSLKRAEAERARDRQLLDVMRQSVSRVGADSM